MFDTRYTTEVVNTLKSGAVKFRFSFFLVLLMLMGILTLFYKEVNIPQPLFVGGIQIFASSLGFLLMMNKIKHVHFVGVIIGVSLLIRPLALMSKFFIENAHTSLGTWTGIVLWISLWNLFTAHWCILFEPYYFTYNKLIDVKIYRVQDLEAELSPSKGDTKELEAIKKRFQEEYTNDNRT